MAFPDCIFFWGGGGGVVTRKQGTRKLTVFEEEELEIQTLRARPWGGDFCLSFTVSDPGWKWTGRGPFAAFLSPAPETPGWAVKPLAELGGRNSSFPPCERAEKGRWRFVFRDPSCLFALRSS